MLGARTVAGCDVRHDDDGARLPGDDGDDGDCLPALCADDRP